MASGSRNDSDSRSFDFGSDDVLCSYDDYNNSSNVQQDNAVNGKRSDPSVKDFHENRSGRTSLDVYHEDGFSKGDLINAVEKSMKKNADNLLRYLEGISGKLSQLEVHCYKIERAVGELRSDIARDQDEADRKIKSLEKHLQEIHRSVQILRDKQELAETQKELSKLHLKEYANSSNLKPSEFSATPSIPEHQKVDVPDTPNYQLSLVLPHQTPAPTSDPSGVEQHIAAAPLGVQQGHYNLSHTGGYYSQQQNIPNIPMKPHSHDLPSQAPAPQQPGIPSQTHLQSTAQYTPQWHQQAPQHGPQQVIQSLLPPQQHQLRPRAPPSYHAYPPPQASNVAPESYPSNAMVQAPYSAISQPSGARLEAVALNYGGPGSTLPQPSAQQQRSEAIPYGGPGSSVPHPSSQHQHVIQQVPPQATQSSFCPNVNKGGYLATAVYTPLPPQPSGQGYNTVYGIDGGRAAHSQSFQAANNYQVSSAPLPKSQQLLPGSNVGVHHPGPQVINMHPYADTVDKAINMGYPRDHVLSVIHRMAESGQQVDINALLDRLNPRSSTASPSGW